MNAPVNFLAGGRSIPSDYKPEPWQLRRAVSRLVYDSCQINRFNRGKMWKCIDSITMNQYNLNISINSIMLLSTYEPTQSTHKNNWNDSIKSINQLNMYICWPFWENLRFRSIQSYQSLKVNRLNHQLYENELTQSPTSSLGKEPESSQSILPKKWKDSNQSTQSSWLVYKSA